MEKLKGLLKNKVFILICCIVLVGIIVGSVVGVGVQISKSKKQKENKNKAVKVETTSEEKASAPEENGVESGTEVSADGDNNTSDDNAGKGDQKDEKDEKDDGAEVVEYEKAYLDILKNSKSDIETYDWRDYSTKKLDNISIYDITGDDVPELIYLCCPENNENANLVIYTYADGKAKEIYNKGIDFCVGGGSSYCLYMKKDSKELQICWSDGGETYITRYGVFKDQGDGTYDFKFDIYHTSGYLEDKGTYGDKYEKNGKEITQADFSKEEKAHLKDITCVLGSNSKGEEEMSDSISGVEKNTNTYDQAKSDLEKSQKKKDTVQDGNKGSREKLSMYEAYTQVLDSIEAGEKIYEYPEGFLDAENYVYSLYDMNGDGVKELFVGAEFLYDVFYCHTYQVFFYNTDGSVHKLNSSFDSMGVLSESEDNMGVFVNVRFERMMGEMEMDKITVDATGLLSEEAEVFSFGSKEEENFQKKHKQIESEDISERSLIEKVK